MKNKKTISAPTLSMPGMAWLLLLASAYLVPGVLAAQATSDPASKTPREAGGPMSTSADSGHALPALPALPEGIASFGAAVLGDDLYVYGGHVGRTHQHSIENLSHRFHRLSLVDPASGWHALGEVDGLQGLPLVAVDGRVCRFGGLQARNLASEDEDLISLDEARCFDPETEGWSDLPPMPTPRSSHDAVVVGKEVYVVGGWQLRGAEEEPVWRDDMAVLDLAATVPAWRTIPQPFQRRALAAATAGGKVYAFGGLDADGTSRRVDIYDPSTHTWSAGPELPVPEGRMKGFGVSAFSVDKRIYLSTADGAIHTLSIHPLGWQEGVGQLDRPRFFHRLLPYGQRLLFVGGAHRDGHLADVEVVPLSSLSSNVSAVSIDDTHPASTRTASTRTASTQTAAQAWPGFRGHGDSHSSATDLPLSWDESVAIAWKAHLPGYGQSSPAIWGNQVFLTSVEGDLKETLILTALDLDSGEVRWRRRFDASQRIENSDMVSRAAPTPVVDEDRIYAFWESGDVVALDHQGESQWRRSLTADYGDFAGNHGVASSPILVGEAVVIQATHDGPSYLVALDRETGVNRWKADLPPGVGWATPVVVRRQGRQEVVSSAAGRVDAFDAATGAHLWDLEGIEKNHVPSPTVANGQILVASTASGQSLLLAKSELNPGAVSGAVSGAALKSGPDLASRARVLWRAEGTSSGFASPLFHGECVLFTNKSGALTCVDPANGSKGWTHRLPEGLWASPVAAGDRAYFFTQKSGAVVLRAAAEGPEILAENPIPLQGTVYGVAAAPAAFVVRSGSEVIRIGKGDG